MDMNKTVDPGHYDLLTESPMHSDGSNSSQGMHQTTLIMDMPESFAVPIVFGIIFVVGVVGNGTLIYTVLRNKSMRNVPNIFIVSLSLGDLLLILVSVPFTAMIYSFSKWPYGEGVCKFNQFLQTLSLGVSVFTLTALSADRYTAIVDPMSKHLGAASQRTIAIAGAIWLLALPVAIADGVSAHVVYIAMADGGLIHELCLEYPEEWGAWYPKFMAILRFLIFFAIPMTIIAVFYLLMANILTASSQHIPVEGQGEGHGQKQMEARRKVARVVLSFVIIFAVCWLPRHIFVLWFHFGASEFNLFWHVFKIMGFCLAFINSCINPLALHFLSKQFRKYYNRYLFCCCNRESRTSERELNSTMYNLNSTVERSSTTMVHTQSMC